MPTTRISGLLVAIILTGQLFAVEPGKPSKTSIWVMAGRAVGARDFDPAVRNPDWLAEQLLGPDERALLNGHPMIKALDRDYREALQDQQIHNLIRGVLVRTRFIDERLIHAVNGGVSQVVILGAGFDTRAYRLRQLLQNAKIFEVDYGPTQEYKKRRIKEVFGAWPENVTYAPIDFTREKLGNVLRKAGYRRDRKTFFIWEGVSMYIPEEAVRATLSYIAKDSAAGGSIVFDYYWKSLIDMIANTPIENAPTDGARRTLVLAKQVADWGEPWIFGLQDNEEEQFVRPLGLEPVVKLAILGPEAERKYVTRRHGSVIVPAPAPPYRYWILEAVVPQRANHARSNGKN